ncbi:YncE family protein [Rhodanobacter denitrificans]|uniref:YncE family protein n=1 Tax=Rhodanobacter denitrificans TaxID=666685 RepID=A0A368KCG2_9GAMM|nr:YncE family protein [Rhodanobacter denitrificans]RCS29612.1 YncE family protein [Rhodanobacter denitrificans]
MKALAWALLLAAGISASAQAGSATGSDWAVTQRYAVGGEGGWDYLTLDPASHRLFIARDDRVMVVDAHSGKLLAQIPGMRHAHGIALLPAQRRGYVSNGHGDDVSVIDLDALKVVGRIAVSGKDPDAIIADPANGHVLAMDARSNSISVIDPVAGKELASIAVPGNPEFAVTDGHGNLFVNLEDKGQLVHVDLKAGKVADVWPLAGCEGPTGLAYDLAAQRLFSVCDNRVMLVVDARDGHPVAKLPIGKGPDAAAYDAARHLVLSSNGDGSLTVVRQRDADHYDVVANVPTQKSARTMALDPQTHEVYLVAAKSAARGKPVEGFEVLVAAGK